VTKTALAGGFDDDAFRRMAEAAAQIVRVNAPAFEGMQKAMDALGTHRGVLFEMQASVAQAAEVIRQVQSRPAFAETLEKLRAIQELQVRVPFAEVSKALIDLRVPDVILDDLERALAELPGEELVVPGEAVATALERSVEVDLVTSSEGEAAIEEYARALTPAQRAIARERAMELIICLLVLAAYLDFKSLTVPALLLDLANKLLRWYRVTEGEV
jgi:hypothetical protein